MWPARSGSCPTVSRSRSDLCISRHWAEAADVWSHVQSPQSSSLSSEWKRCRASGAVIRCPPPPCPALTVTSSVSRWGGALSAVFLVSSWYLNLDWWIFHLTSYVLLWLWTTTPKMQCSKKQPDYNVWFKSKTFLSFILKFEERNKNTLSFCPILCCYLWSITC